MSYLPSFLSISMRWSKVSEKYWNSAFCLCTSSPRMRFRNLVMEQSGGQVGRGLRLCQEGALPGRRGGLPAGGLHTGLTLLHIQTARPGLAPTNANGQQALLHVCGREGLECVLLAPLPPQPAWGPRHRCPLGKCVWEESLDTNPVCPKQLRAKLPHTLETLTCPQLTPEKGGISSGVALGQRHLVLSLAQDGGKDAAEGPGAVLSGGVRGVRRA